MAPQIQIAQQPNSSINFHCAPGAVKQLGNKQDIGNCLVESNAKLARKSKMTEKL
jgi:hypothetical protein